MVIQLSVNKRDVFGKKAKSLVDDNQVLGNLYGKDQDSIAVVGEYNVVNKVIQEAGKNHPIDITVGDDTHMALIHDIERDPLTQRIHHVTFHLIKKGEKVTTQVPIRLVGDAPAQRTGKIVVTLLDSVEVESIPSKIPEAFELSLESLEEVNDQISISDIPTTEDVTILVEPETLIAKVDEPRAALEDEEPEEELDEGEVPSEHGSADEESSGAGEESDKE
jgi:large subunit ribosomal protein L25